tara:strand:- start:655 stop:846 length:192 start_codon:yes stop_codon:yes gene_type:complete
MAFYIQKPSVMLPGTTVYYTGNRRWSVDPADKKTWATSTTPTNLMANPDGKNGGWTGATVVEE